MPRKERYFKQMIEWQAEEQRINMAVAGLQAPSGDRLLDANKAKNEGRTMVFVDESGLSERPHRCRMWAPRGHTPVLQYHFNWKTLSAMAGVTWWNIYFRLFPSSIRSRQVVEFLSYPLRQPPMLFHQFDFRSVADHLPLLRFVKHSSQGPQSAVGIRGRAGKFQLLGTIACDLLVDSRV